MRRRSRKSLDIQEEGLITKVQDACTYYGTHREGWARTPKDCSLKNFLSWIRSHYIQILKNVPSGEMPTVNLAISANIMKSYLYETTLSDQSKSKYCFHMLRFIAAIKFFKVQARLATCAKIFETVAMENLEENEKIINSFKKSTSAAALKTKMNSEKYEMIDADTYKQIAKLALDSDLSTLSFLK